MRYHCQERHWFQFMKAEKTVKPLAWGATNSKSYIFLSHHAVVFAQSIGARIWHSYIIYIDTRYICVVYFLTQHSHSKKTILLFSQKWVWYLRAWYLWKIKVEERKFSCVMKSQQIPFHDACAEANNKKVREKKSHYRKFPKLDM